MIYDLSNCLQRERFKKRCRQLYKDQRLVELTDATKRSSSQNNYLHLIVSYLASEIGVTTDYAKAQYYKLAANKELFLETEIDPITKEPVSTLKSSATLTAEQMTLSIQRFIDWANDVAEIALPLATDEDFLREIMIEINRNKRYI